MKVLIVVDVQEDFISGSLAVKDAEQIIPMINNLIGSGKFNKVVLTQDYHPFQHHSFKSSGHNGIWPDHCIKGTRGVEFHSHLHTQNADLIIRKGTNLEVDSYSGLYEADGTSTGLTGYLGTQKKWPRVYVVGLALDYCVKYTAMDCNEDDYTTYVIQDACKAVNINPDDEQKALDEMRDAGITIINSDDI